jgi:DNA-binding CsgD family transcriptional regulator
MTENDVIDQVYSAIADPGRWTEVIVRISDYLGAVGGLLQHIGPGGRLLLVLGRISEEHAKIVQQHYVWNPWSIAMKDVPSDKAVISNSLIEPRELFRSGFHTDVLAPLGIENALQTRHDALAQGGGLGGFGFMLSSRGSERAHHALPRLQRLTPHLSRALDATMQVGRIAGRAETLAALLHVMPNPALLLDRSGRIAHANSSAERLLNAGDGLSFDRDGRLQLAAVLPAELVALTRALALALQVAAGEGAELSEPVRISRPSGAGPLLVIPVPLPPPAFELWELLDTARVLVLIVDPSAQSGSAGPILRKTFGLTAAEARVALLVGKGLSGPQAAIALGISAATAKTHLARCFDKLGVRSQVMLSRLINAMPVALPAGGRT